MSETLKARNIIDRAIEFVSPSTAASRYVARANLEMAQQAMERHRNSAASSGARSSARGAARGRFDQPWGRSNTTRGGTRGERLDLQEMADRANRIYDENVIGGGLLDTETDNVVADGFSLQMQTADDAFNLEAEKRFYKWLSKADITGLSTGTDLFRDSWSEPRKEGDGGFLLIKNGTGMQPRLQYVQRDMIKNPMKIPDGTRWEDWFDGVLLDVNSAPVGYNLRSVDGQTGQILDVFIAARDFIYLRPKKTKRNVRGQTVYRRIFTQLDQLDSLLDAWTKAAILGAIFGLVEKRRNPAAAMAGLETMVNSAGNDQKAISYEDGMVKIMEPEGGIYQVDAKQPMTQAPDYLKAMLRVICLAFDMPLEIGARNLADVNFSGGRIGLIAYYRSCKVKQEWLIERCWNRIVFWWLSVEKQRQQYRGQLGYEDVFQAEFPADYGEFTLHAQEWEFNDPLTEAQADLLEMTIGTNDVQTICEKKNRDYNKIRARRVKQLAEDRADKIPVVLSNVSRDEKTTVTAVDDQGNPLSGNTSAPLNGIQITSALDVLAKVSEKTTNPQTAIELLTRLNIAPDKAAQMVAAASKTEGISTSDRAFQREMLKLLATNPAARDAVYEGTDMEDLMAQAGMPIEVGYQFPHIPVVAPAGQLVSGAVITDPAGDVVGGDVENDLAPDAATQGGGKRNVDPPASPDLSQD